MTEITRFDEVVPSDGSLTARIFENQHIGLKPTLFFDIEIPIQPFRFNGEEISTAVRLEFIKIPVQSDWREIAGQSFDFPVNPEEGYIDGSIYLDGAHNPADATRLTFGTIESGRILCEARLSFDFTFEGPEELGMPTLTWNVPLLFDARQLDAVVSEAQRLSK